MLAAPGICEDAILLHALVEALQGRFKVFVFTDNDFSQPAYHPAFVPGCRSRGMGKMFTVACRGRGRKEH